MKTIIFDFGGVLLDLDYAKTIGAFAALGLDNPGEAFSKYRQDALFRRFERGEVVEEEFLRALGDQMGGADPEAIQKAWCSMLGSLPHEKYELLRTLGRRYDLYLLSNTNALHQKCFERILKEQYGAGAFEQLFKGIGYSHEMGCRKPDAEIYRVFLDRFGIDAAETLFIDDTEANVDAARELGIPALHYRDGSDLQALIDRHLKSV